MKIAQTESQSLYYVFTKDRADFMTQYGNITLLPSFNTKGKYIESYFRHFKTV